MVSNLSKRDLEEIKGSLDKIIYKVLGNNDTEVANSAYKCISSGYDKYKTIKKISSIIETRKAEKISDRLFDLVDDIVSSKSRKRVHDSSNNDVDSKRSKNDSRSENKTQNGNSQSAEIKLDATKIKEMMANAQREIEERKKQFDSIKVMQTLPKPTVPHVAMFSVSQGIVDAEKAKKIAALQAQIQSKLASGILQKSEAPSKPTPLILDEQGRTIDITGKTVQLQRAVPTLKANIRAKKREEFKIQLNEKTSEELTETNFFDPRIGLKPAVRNKRALRFHEPGKFQQLADRLRMKAHLEKLQSEISQIAKKTGISSATKLALIAKGENEEQDETPAIEWWDSVVVLEDLNKLDDKGHIAIKDSIITNLVEHPTQIKPPNEPKNPIYMPVFLTKKERKKLRRQNRREMWKEEQEKIRLGLEAPPEPKLRISNLMRVLGTEAVQDPTKIEAHVREQMAKRQKAHEEANAARQLTAEQRREKNINKLKEDTTLGVHVAVYRITDLHDSASKKFKVETNAKQLFMTGCVILFRNCSVVVVEGGAKQQKKYKRLMLNRIKWSEDLVKNTEGKQVPNKCVLVWEGMTKQRNFGDIKFKVCPTERLAREHFKKHKVEHYWDLAYSGAVLEPAIET